VDIHVVTVRGDVAERSAMAEHVHARTTVHEHRKAGGAALLFGGMCTPDE
jgi:hypothetical protein